MLLLLFSFSLVLCFIKSQNFLSCGPDYCSLRAKCEPLSCEDGRIVKNVTKCGCCDICIRNLTIGDECLTYGDNIESMKECGDGLVCGKIEGIKGKCVPSKCLTMAEKYQDEGDKSFFKMNFACDYFGNFEPVVCIEGALCFCVDKKGKRIFGTDFAVNKDSMNCNCSQDINDFPREVDVETLPRCLQNGDYDSLQCVGSKCFCMEPRSYHDDVDDIEIEMDQLPCYESVRHKNKRETDCLVRRKLFRKENLTTIAVDDTQCDLDGSYSPAQPEGSSYSCVSSTGTKLDYQNEKKIKDLITCRCLRDKEMVQNSANNAISKENKLNFQKIDCMDSAKSNNILPESFFKDFMK